MTDMHLERYQKEWAEKTKTGEPIGALHGAGVLVGERIGITAEREKVLALLDKLIADVQQAGDFTTGTFLAAFAASLEAGEHAPWGKLKGDDNETD